MSPFADIRRDYSGEPLSETDSEPHPFAQFSRWFDQVRGLEADPTAFALATATADGRPSVRTVLLKGVDDRGFVFYTNYASPKARDLAANPKAALLFFWPPDRQVRVSGPVEKATPEESERYWRNRPRASQLSAWASRQSEVIESRAALERRVAELAAAGATNKDIAAELYVSVKAVEFHLRNAYAKLGIRSRAQLAARMRDEGVDSGQIDADVTAPVLWVADRSLEDVTGTIRRTGRRWTVNGTAGDQASLELALDGRTRRIDGRFRARALQLDDVFGSPETDASRDQPPEKKAA